MVVDTMKPKSNNITDVITVEEVANKVIVPDLIDVSSRTVMFEQTNDLQFLKPYFEGIYDH